ncbi:MAG TPA: CDP-alcohol phosphatidyltransferase family protein [Gammaproteobacteria bacterium]|nr:CDP-alcohol phosphatidyltransferase family protein [Gammaproteobacteria bacterium]
MLSIYELKPAFQSLLRPITAKLAKAGVTANQVTVTATVISFIAGGLLALFPEKYFLFLSLPLILFIRMGLNAIDGMLAREHHMKSPLGAILNEMGDVLSDVALYLPFALIIDVNPLLVVAMVILAILTEMAGILGAQIGASRRYDGPMGKSDRAFLFGLVGLLIGLGFNIFSWLNPLFVVINILLVVTIINRCRLAIREITA